MHKEYNVTIASFKIIDYVLEANNHTTSVDSIDTDIFTLYYT